MDFDFTTFSERINDPRFQTTLCGAPLVRPIVGELNNRGKLSKQFKAEAPASAWALAPDNVEARLELTKAFGAPGVRFYALRTSTASYCLTYWQWGPGYWAYQTTAEGS